MQTVQLALRTSLHRTMVCIVLIQPMPVGTTGMQRRSFFQIQGIGIHPQFHQQFQHVGVPSTCRNMNAIFSPTICNRQRLQDVFSSMERSHQVNQPLQRSRSASGTNQMKNVQALCVECSQLLHVLRIVGGTH
jgi:hypothetical protein